MSAFGGKADIALGSPIPAYLKKPAPQKNAAHDRELLKAFSKLDYRVYRGSTGGFPVSAG
jgi:hypothetical protein